MENNKALAYLFLRLGIGISFLGHGIVRLSKIPAFRSWMIGLFNTSLMPEIFAYWFASVLPFVELLLGILLIIGWHTRVAYILGSAVICTLIFGSCLIENWEAVAFQLIYGLLFFILLFYMEYNKYALEKSFSGRKE
ncbi:DoxX family membrane protein [Olivibacter domesticus]|uniref:Thiosulfate dehydrogenase [quinone] large subunit n=1 Tax=Olivibacter domesticus TaxID=407022 RepID=A0A1H7HCK7_OLID1|nr:DoxX family membrane protein [Olivibacter domesticus]SEK48019.1 thiosulfate dehydrogenase [quinone] large subunit [Olivibacter domesticus]